jgi:prepilin-type N-terminal cleavage/methylation domain-containing protein
MGMYKSKQNGFSLVELAIGLAVVSVLILAISLSSGIRDNARVQSAANSIQTMRSAAEGYLASGRLNYTGVNVATLKTNNLLPTNFNATNSNPWGGSFTVAPDAASPTRFNIALSSVPTTDAPKLTAFFNNLASSTSYDAGSKQWAVTF